MLAQQHPQDVHSNLLLRDLFMPLYVFKCDKCEEKIEVLQAFGDPEPDCQDCQVPMIKQVAFASFILQGSGWAKDNYGLKDD